MYISRKDPNRYEASTLILLVFTKNLPLQDNVGGHGDIQDPDLYSLSQKRPAPLPPPRLLLASARPPELSSSARSSRASSARPSSAAGSARPPELASSAQQLLVSSRSV